MVCGYYIYIYIYKLAWLVAIGEKHYLEEPSDLHKVVVIINDCQIAGLIPQNYYTTVASGTYLKPGI